MTLTGTSRLFVFMAGCLLTLGPAPAFAYSDDPIAPFYGRYVGKSIDGSPDQSGTRDTEVVIKPAAAPAPKGGFNLQWSTTIHRPEKTSTRKFSINFQPHGSKSVYSSAMRVNMFGQEVPLNPLKGDPYVWAVVEGKTLTVHSLLIFEDGGYEVQTYVRRLTQTGLDLNFTRIRNGEVKKKIQGKLLRKR